MKLKEVLSPCLFYSRNVQKIAILHQHVSKPTRPREEQESLLDLIFTKKEDDVKNIEILGPLGKSDHGVIVCDVVCEWKENVVFTPKRMYHKENYNLMNRLIKEVNWDTAFEGLNIHQKWALFKSKLENFADQCIPMSEPNRYKTPWMNQKVVKAYRNKYLAWKHFMEHRISTKWKTYVKERNAASKVERDEKRAFEKRLAKEIGLNRRGFFKYVTSKLTVRPKTSALRNENGEMIHDDKEMCNLSNRYFHSLFNQPTQEEDSPDMDYLCNENIGDMNVSPEIVKERLEALNRFKESGPDNIHPHVLKETSVCVPLSMIFKESLEVGETPEDWRTVYVTPIFKKGDRNDPAIYRPVSLTS